MCNVRLEERSRILAPLPWDVTLGFRGASAPSWIDHPLFRGSSQCSLLGWIPTEKHDATTVKRRCEHRNSYYL